MSEFSIGQKVRINDTDVEGIIRYVGETRFAPGSWIGVELNSHDGKNDGSVQGERYFDCDMGKGMFLRPASLTIVAQPVAKPTNGTAVKKPARPSSVSGPLGRRLSTAPDSAAGKRQNMNSASPTPAGRGSRTSNILRVCVREVTFILLANYLSVPYKISNEAAVGDDIECFYPSNWDTFKCENPFRNIIETTT